jgi:hypothetical protein
LLALAAAGAWRLLALADWSPAAAVDQDRLSGRSRRSRVRGTGISVLAIGSMLTFGLMDRLLPSTTAFLAGVTIATLVFRPRWPVVAARWLMPFVAGAGAVGLLLDDVRWRTLAFLCLAMLITLHALRPRFRPGLPSFRQWLGLRDGGRSASGSAGGASSP